MVTRRSSSPTGHYEATHENLRSGVLIDYPGDLDIAPRRGGERFDVRRRKTTESQAGPKIFFKIADTNGTGDQGLLSRGWPRAG